MDMHTDFHVYEAIQYILFYNLLHLIIHCEHLVII